MNYIEFLKSKNYYSSVKIEPEKIKALFPKNILVENPREEEVEYLYTLRETEVDQLVTVKISGEKDFVEIPEQPVGKNQARPFILADILLRSINFAIPIDLVVCEKENAEVGMFDIEGFNDEESEYMRSLKNIIFAPSLKNSKTENMCDFINNGGFLSEAIISLYL